MLTSKVQTDKKKYNIGTAVDPIRTLYTRDGQLAAFVVAVACGSRVLLTKTKKYYYEF